MPGRRRLPRATPESQGLPSAAVTGFLDAVAEAHQELHSLMVVVRGAVVAEGWWAPYERERRHELFSLSKSFTSTAVGFAQAEGLREPDGGRREALAQREELVSALPLVRGPPALGHDRTADDHHEAVQLLVRLSLIHISEPTR